MVHRKLDSFKNRLKFWLISGLALGLNYITNSLTRIKVYGEENLTGIDEKTPVILVFWHGKLWVPAYFFRKRDCVTLASLSNDGEYITRVLEKYGYRVVRGSSSRGGGRALLRLLREAKKGATVLLTPDGPRGPIYRVKPGAILLQEKSDGVIIPVGIAASKKKVFNSWDRFTIPLPGSKVVINYGKPLKLPEGKSVEEKCHLVEENLREVQARARDLVGGS
ncbi:lysophospholipid acyltransferase family protein [Halothermothrix orenii]|uniref:lysophospholipid acyltransferase family protein n=1 Tax=Halothermothrix orenii TaxID=31909 RepID=UPI00143C84A8|nr:lysophospholipid acyltransferase family protein [Halothermothrix orenii]